MLILWKAIILQRNKAEKHFRERSEMKELQSDSDSACQYRKVYKKVYNEVWVSPSLH